MEGIPFPPPYQGQADFLPLAVLQSPFAEIVQNYNLDDGVPTLRHGDSTWTTNAGVVQSPVHIATYGEGSTQKMFAVYENSLGADHLYWRDISTAGSGTDVYNIAVGNDFRVFSLFFNNYLFFFGNNGLSPARSGPQYYNGTAWGAAAYVWPTNFVPMGGCVYKNRAYFIKNESSSYGYSEIDATAGTVTQVDLASVITNKSRLFSIRSISLSEGIQQENVLAFIFESGEVLVYAGSYPNADPWTIIGRFIIPKPKHYHSVIDGKGDSFIITESALVSLRTLFIQGYEVAVQRGLSFQISNRWAQLFGPNLYNYEYLRGVYDPCRERLVITIPSGVTRLGVSDGTRAMRLIYSFKNKAWWEVLHFSPYTTDVAYFKNEVYFGALGGGVSQAEGRSDFRDARTDGFFASIQYQLRTCPLPMNKFGVNQIQGIEIISKTDLFAQTYYKLVANLGQVETTPQLLPSQGGGVANPMINVGNIGNYIQLDISGTATSAATVGQYLYAFNIWNERGGAR